MRKMKSLRNIFLMFFLIVFFMGCSAMFVGSTNDPHQKLTDAYGLLYNQNRPIPAEKLIQEAIEIFQKENDASGLAKGYATYGLFFNSPAVGHFSPYKTKGFLDKTVQYDQRYQKALWYFDKAKEILKKEQDSELNMSTLSMILFYEAETYLNMYKTDSACKRYKKHIIKFKEYVSKYPDMKKFRNMSADSYEEYKIQMKYHMWRIGCENSDLP